MGGRKDDAPVLGLDWPVLQGPLAVQQRAIDASWKELKVAQKLMLRTKCHLMADFSRRRKSSCTLAVLTCMLGSEVIRL